MGRTLSRHHEPRESASCVVIAAQTRDRRVGLGGRTPVGTGRVAGNPWWRVAAANFLAPAIACFLACAPAARVGPSPSEANSAGTAATAAGQTPSAPVVWELLGDGRIARDGVLLVDGIERLGPEIVRRRVRRAIDTISPSAADGQLALLLRAEGEAPFQVCLAVMQEWRGRAGPRKTVELQVLMTGRSGARAGEATGHRSYRARLGEVPIGYDPHNPVDLVIRTLPRTGATAAPSSSTDAGGGTLLVNAESGRLSYSIGPQRKRTLEELMPAMNSLHALAPGFPAHVDARLGVSCSEAWAVVDAWLEIGKSQFEFRNWISGGTAGRQYWHITPERP